MPKDIEIISWRKQDHNQSPEGFEDWLRGRCEYECAICLTRFFDSDAFWGHDEVREMGMDAYKKKYKTYYAEKGKKPHYCRIPRCHKKMDWDKSKISSHFIKNHPDISLRSYYCSYIKSETIKTEFQDTDGESLDEDSGFSEFRTPSPHGKGKQLGRKHRSRSRKGEKHINAQIKTEPEDYKNNIAPDDDVEFVANIHHANIPSTSYNSPHNIKKHPHGDDKPRPKSKKLKNMSTDKKTPEKQMATEKDHNEGKKTREKEKETSQNVSDLHDTNETHSKDNGREDGVNNVVGPSSVANDEMDTSEPSDAEKSSGTADEGESASTEKTSTSAEKISQLANSFPPREMTEKSFHVTNEDREITEQTDHSEHGKGMHGTEEREEVIKTPLQGTADERGSTFLPSEPSDTEKTRNTSSDDREITLMEQESEEQVSSVAESNPPSMQITEQRPHIANEGGGDGKGLHGKDREVILKPVPSGEMAKLKLWPVPYQEIERIFQNKVDSKMRRKCKGCDFDRKSMSHHLRFKRSCKELYSQQELDTLQREARAQRAKEKRKKKEQESPKPANDNRTSNISKSTTQNTDTENIIVTPLIDIKMEGEDQEDFNIDEIINQASSEDELHHYQGEQIMESKKASQAPPDSKKRDAPIQGEIVMGLKAIEKSNSNTTKNANSLWYDGCRYKCGMCICEYKHADGLGHHLRNKHDLHSAGASSKKYRDNIVLLSATYHDCLVCGAKVLRNRHEIRVHVSNKHKMKFLNYQAYRVKQLSKENEMRDAAMAGEGANATEEISADSEENTRDNSMNMGDNASALGKEMGGKSDNATSVTENTLMLKISGSWTLNDNALK